MSQDRGSSVFDIKGTERNQTIRTDEAVQLPVNQQEAPRRATRRRGAELSRQPPGDEALVSYRTSNVSAANTKPCWSTIASWNSPLALSEARTPNVPR